MKWRSLEESNPDIDTRTLREQLAERKELIAKYDFAFFLWARNILRLS